MIFQCFVPHRLVQVTNGSLSRAHWSHRSEWSNERKQSATLMIRQAIRQVTPAIDPRAPKAVLFTATVWNFFDDDNLPPACKPYRDSLIREGVIHSDAKQSGHQFLYDQKVVRDRAQLGVEIRVAYLDPAT